MEIELSPDGKYSRLRKLIEGKLRPFLEAENFFDQTWEVLDTEGEICVAARKEGVSSIRCVLGYRAVRFSTAKSSKTVLADGSPRYGKYGRSE